MKNESPQNLANRLRSEKWARRRSGLDVSVKEFVPGLNRATVAVFDNSTQSAAPTSDLTLSVIKIPLQSSCSSNNNSPPETIISSGYLSSLECRSSMADTNPSLNDPIINFSAADSATENSRKYSKKEMCGIYTYMVETKTLTRPSSLPNAFNNDRGIFDPSKWITVKIARDLRNSESHFSTTCIMNSNSTAYNNAQNLAQPGAL